MFSVVIPVYNNSLSIQQLIDALDELRNRLTSELEVVFVVDGSPDDSYSSLIQLLPRASFPSQLLTLSRNFGSFAAVRAGLEAARGDRFGVMAADLQEPPELILEFDRILRSGEYDVAVGQRAARNDPVFSRLLSGLFWAVYRSFVQPEVPPGGVDVFGCQRIVRDQIIQLQESNSSLIGLLFWIGFRRATVSYERRRRSAGKTGWTLRKRFRYMSDSLFSFTDLPLRLLLAVGLAGLLATFFLGSIVIAAKLSGAIEVPGYAATVLLIMFFGGLNCFGFGVIGGYIWRSFENTKRRPNFIVASRQAFPGGDRAGAAS